MTGRQGRCFAPGLLFRSHILCALPRIEGAERRTGDPLQGLGGLSSVSREPSSFGNYSNVLSETSGERQCRVRFFDAFYTIFAEMILSNLSHLGGAYKTSVCICTGILPEAFRVTNEIDGGRQRCARFVCCSLSLPRPLSPPEKLPYASKVTASKRWMKRSDDCNQIVLTYFTFTDSTVNIAKSNDFGRFFHKHLNASWGIDENRRRQSVVSFSSTRRRRPSKASGRGAPYAVEWSDGHKKNGGLEKPRHGMLPLRGNERGKDQRSGA